MNTPEHGRNISRRSFLSITGIAGLGLALKASAPLFAKSLTEDSGLKQVSSTRLAMGTTVTVLLISENEKAAREAINMAFIEIERLSNLMNHYRDGTEISLLNRNGIIHDASDEILEVISEAVKYHRLTGGAFDITIYPVIELFRKSFSRGAGMYPERDEIRKVLELVGSDKIAIEGRSVRLRKKGMSITLDGIAKGYIADRASGILMNNGYENHLINAGGDISGSGLRKDKRPWRVAIQDPKNRDSRLDVIDLHNRAVATSGNYENYFDKEMLYHHIADPATGLSPSNTTSASVTAPTAMAADALATALMVMGPERGTKFIDMLSEHESLIVTRDKRERRSSGWVSRKRG